MSSGRMLLTKESLHLAKRSRSYRHYDSTGLCKRAAQVIQVQIGVEHGKSEAVQSCCTSDTHSKSA